MKDFEYGKSTVPELLMKPVVYEGFHLWKITVPGLLIKPVVYAGF